MKNISKRNSTYWKVGFVTLVMLLTTGSMLVAGQSRNGYQHITKTYAFSAPQVYQKTIDDQVYDQIIMADAEGAWKVGEPDLPAYGISLLLPQGTIVTDITVQSGNVISLGSGFLVKPTEEPVKLSEFTSDVTLPMPDESIYSSLEAFPGTLFNVVGTYSFRGYDVLIVLLYPVQYIPNSGTLSYFEDMTISIQTAYNGHLNPLFRGELNDQVEIARKVDNPDIISSYTINPTAPLTAGGYKLLILTTDLLKSGFTPLKDAHNAQGLATEIKTLSDISPLPGSVTAEDIREFIKTEYITNGIEYVLIGGDNEIIPAKQLWVTAGNEKDNMPSDLYYACLDGTYNFDEDEFWGEKTDGVGGGDVDLMAEVYVGRASVDNLAETNNFVQKTLTYMNSGGYSSGNALFVGEYLWGPPKDEVTFGDEYMEELIDGSNHNGYSTVGIPSNTYTISRLYDHNWSGFDINNPWDTGWETQDIVARINNGVHFINHLGHSATTYNLRMTPGDTEDLTNTIFPFIYSQGCYAGAFDDVSDSMAEYFTVKTTHGAFAAIMCARYGWGTPGSTNGPNQRFHRFFWDAVFGENITSIGKANQDSKEENVKKINGPCMRWVYYEMNLFGDPTLTFFSRPNTAPNKPSTPQGTARGTVQTSYTFTASTTDADGDDLYYKWSFGDGTFSAWLGPYHSGEQVNVSHNWSTSGKYEVKVKAYDEHRSVSDWSDPFPVKMSYESTFPIIKWLFDILERYCPRLYSLLNPA
jgi:hypothetical protein